MSYLVIDVKYPILYFLVDFLSCVNKCLKKISQINLNANMLNTTTLMTDNTLNIETFQIHPIPGYKKTGYLQQIIMPL